MTEPLVNSDAILDRSLHDQPHPLAHIDAFGVEDLAIGLAAKLAVAAHFGMPSDGPVGQAHPVSLVRVLEAAVSLRGVRAGNSLIHEVSLA